MARACIVLFFVSFIIACDFSNGFLTRGRNLEAVFTNDAPAPQDAMEEVRLESVPVEEVRLESAPVEEVGLESVPVEEVGLETVPVEEVGLESAPVKEVELESAPVQVLVKKCAKIGEFCMNHSDCCTNACLGYMKRCVS